MGLIKQLYFTSLSDNNGNNKYGKARTRTVRWRTIRELLTLTL
jgi:hypothetical protein